MHAKKRDSGKVVALLLAVVLVFGCAVGGTLAWLMDTSNTVINTFSVGNINIKLEETVEKDGFKILPGTEQIKDPVVKVKDGSEDCWVFIQVQEVNNVAAKDGGNVTHKYVTWEIDDTVWTILNENNGVTTYYANTMYETGSSSNSYNVLKGQSVSYGSTLTKSMIDSLYKDGAPDEGKRPQLIFKAFAVQAEAGHTAAEAWSQIPELEYLHN